MGPAGDVIAAVVIGRNEGERLRRCLQSLTAVLPGVYVDSGSTDGSQALARGFGFGVVDLDVSEGFTAAKARNAGLAKLLEERPNLRFVQMIDGDCELERSWPRAGIHALSADPDLAAVFGRRKERYPVRNIYHEATDLEWDVPAGEVNSCGGDVIFRVAALSQVGGYDPSLIAGEEPELCLRLRQRGWRIRCLDEPMTVHDVDMTSFAQWWRRAKRAGYAFANLNARYGSDADPHWYSIVRSALGWSAVMAAGGTLLVLSILTGMSILCQVGVLALALCLAQIGRTAWRHRRFFASPLTALHWSALLFAAKLAQTGGWWRAGLDRSRARQGVLIEYK